ncbi:MAG: hypothetical protein WBB27_17595 [Maribacter sp.]
MGYKSNAFGRQHNTIKTKYVFNEDEQVFVKKKDETTNSISNEKWQPINFQWIPVLELHEKL